MTIITWWWQHKHTTRPRQERGGELGGEGDVATG